MHWLSRQRLQLQLWLRQLRRNKVKTESDRNQLRHLFRKMPQFLLLRHPVALPALTTAAEYDILYKEIYGFYQGFFVGSHFEIDYCRGQAAGCFLEGVN